MGRKTLVNNREILVDNREYVAVSVIQATGTVEFEDGLRTGLLHGDCFAIVVTSLSPGSIPIPSWDEG